MPPPAAGKPQADRHVGADLTDVGHWDDTWVGDIRLRLPSRLIVPTRDLQRLLSARVRRGQRVLEVGCAPGKMLAWAAASLGASVSGLDFSSRGLDQAKRLFMALGLRGDLRCEDLRATTFPTETFDVVYSVGVIEHFADPRQIVRCHLELVRPGGLVLVTVPNYKGIYGRLQRYFDPDNLLQHNLEIMSCDALQALARDEAAGEIRSYPFGRMSPWLVSTSKRWPAPVALAASHLVNAAAWLQPVDLAPLCPMLVLEIEKVPRA